LAAAGKRRPQIGRERDDQGEASQPATKRQKTQTVGTKSTDAGVKKPYDVCQHYVERETGVHLSCAFLGRVLSSSPHTVSPFLSNNQKALAYATPGWQLAALDMCDESNVASRQIHKGASGTLYMEVRNNVSLNMRGMPRRCCTPRICQGFVLPLGNWNGFKKEMRRESVM
jgi:hypothetical protein